MMTAEERKNLQDVAARIGVVYGEINIVLRKRLLAVDPLPIKLLEAETKELVDKAMRECEKAEKALSEGRVKEAMKHEAECTRLLGEAAGN